jgi:hypothetical protein
MLQGWVLSELEHERLMYVLGRSACENFLHVTQHRTLEAPEFVARLPL